MQYGQSISDEEPIQGQIPHILAVNIKGVCNTSNETKYEKDAPDGISINFNFYKTFWSMQVVLNTFEAQPLSDEEGNTNNLEDEAATFNIKYLTSSKLMGLELKESSFRHHVLVQCLILFDYLKAPKRARKIFLLKQCKPRWRLGNKQLSQLWKWAEDNQNALTDPQRVRTPKIEEYWKPLADDMDEAAGIEPEYHHKNNRVYCWKGLRFSARQDLQGFSKFTEYGIEGVLPLDLLPSNVRSKYQAKPRDRSLCAKEKETKSSTNQAEENQIATPASEIDGDRSRVDLEASTAQMDINGTTGTISQVGTPTPEDQQKQGSDTDSGQEAGQIEADCEAEPGMIDGEMDADMDLVATG